MFGCDRAWTHRDNSLKAHVEVLLLVHLQFLQRHSGFSDKLVVPELVLIADRQPAEIKEESLSQAYYIFRSVALGQIQFEMWTQGCCS